MKLKRSTLVTQHRKDKDSIYNINLNGDYLDGILAKNKNDKKPDNVKGYDTIA